LEPHLIGTFTVPVAQKRWLLATGKSFSWVSNRISSCLLSLMLPTDYPKKSTLFSQSVFPASSITTSLSFMHYNKTTLHLSPHWDRPLSILSY
jgi:hypothetical protein